MKINTLVVILMTGCYALHAQQKVNSNDIYLKASTAIKEANNGDPNISVVMSDNIIAKYPKSYIGYYVKAYAIYHIPGKVSNEAVVNLDKCLSINPNYAEAYSLRGLLSNPNNISKKINDYELAIKYETSKENLADDYGKLASLKCDALDWNGALIAVNKCLMLDKKSYEGYSTRGHIYIELKNYYSALADLDTAIDIYADDAFSYFYRGIAKANMDNSTSACKDFDRARFLIKTRQFDDTINQYCK